MTFDAQEFSDFGGAPSELYEFRRVGQTWRYTTALEKAVVDLVEYKPAIISRSNVEANSKPERVAVTLETPRDFPVAVLYQKTPPTEPVMLTIWQYHETDGTAEKAVIYSGRILSVTFDVATAKIYTEPVLTSIKRVGLRRAYSRGCPFVLYSGECGATRESFRQTVAVQGIDASGTVVQCSDVGAQANGYFSGGFIEKVGTVTERRHIVGHITNQIYLSNAMPGLKIGDTLDIYPGCNHTVDTCRDRFGNLVNYGGFPYFSDNPFGGKPIF